MLGLRPYSASDDVQPGLKPNALNGNVIQSLRCGRNSSLHPTKHLDIVVLFPYTYEVYGGGMLLWQSFWPLGTKRRPTVSSAKRREVYKGEKVLK